MVYQTGSKEVAEQLARELTELNPGWLFSVVPAGLNYKTGQHYKSHEEADFVVVKFRPYKAGYKEVGYFTWDDNVTHTKVMFRKTYGEVLYKEVYGQA
jgi:hypothetical protein